MPDRYVLVDAHQQPVDFTQGEYGLLLALAQNSRRVLICEQLLDLIHGETTEVFDRTICHERCNSDPHPTPEIRSRG
ncbi:winged helix-turn-helix domain-containing protein [Escherichia coli]|nr:winged helix-turn-helix domain-containing protein [Escherichia coli]